MALDLFTLYTVILLQSLTLTLIWSAIWFYYPSLVVARTWMASNLAVTVGGATLALEAPTGSLVPVLVGNVLVIFGFCAAWAGVRQFQGRPPPWRASLGLSLLCLVALVVLQDSRVARNAIYTIGQSAPLLIACSDLLTGRRCSPGGMLAETAMLVAVAGNAVKMAGIIAHDSGAMGSDIYGVILFCSMLCVIFSGLSWNFGFLLIVIDHLRSELAELAVTDELTGLPNRRRFMQRLAEEEARARRTGRTFSLIMIDMDAFKSINDTWGHAAGDAALVHLGTIMAAQIRRNDLLARLGGDEFCIILPETTHDSAAVVAGHIAAAVGRAPLAWRDRAVGLQLSLGIAEWSAAHASPTDLLHEVDAALYAQKQRCEAEPQEADAASLLIGSCREPMSGS